MEKPPAIDSGTVDFTAWLENTVLSVWIRESPSMLAFPGILVLHAIGMAFLAGPNAAIDLRILGFARGVPRSLMKRFVPVMQVGFIVNAFSGLLLLIAYPTKALTNPIFYIKLGCIAAAVAVVVWMRRTLFLPHLDSVPVNSRVKFLAVASLILWAGAIFAGRLLAYTCTWMLVDSRC